MSDGKVYPDGEDRLEALERTNRELSRQIEDLRRAAAEPRSAPVAGLFRRRNFMRRVMRRLAAVTTERGVSPKARWVIESGMFDADAYKALAGLSGVSDLRAASHYATVGEQKGIPPSAAFDPVVYRSVYPDVGKSEMGLLVHYSLHGRAERRLASFASSEHLRPGARPFDPAKRTALVVCHEASRTGAPILGWNLVRALAATHNVVVVLLHGGELVGTFAADATFTVGPFETAALYPLPMRRLVETIAERFEIDFAIVNSVEAHPVLFGLSANFVPTVALIHEFAANVYPPGTMTSALQCSTQVVFDAEMQRQAALDEWPGITTLNQSVFHQGASEVPRAAGQPAAADGIAAKRQKIEQEVRGASRRPVVLGLGTVSMRKGVDLFIMVAAAVASKLGTNAVRFVWIGDVPEPHPDGIYADWITDQVKRAGLHKSLVFLDPVDDLHGAFAAAAVVLSPSRLDPFPNVAMDAALAGVPVICFERGNGFSEFLAGDAATRSLAVGFLDVAAAADRIVDLLGDEPERSRVGAALQARAREDFTMQRYVERLGPVIARAQAIAAQERRDVALLERDETFSAWLWLDPHQTETRKDAIRFHVRKAASGQEAAQYTRRPALGFVPQTYAEHHPVLEAPPFENPLAHWVRAGKPEGPWCHRVTIPQVDGARPSLSKGTPSRAVLHIHLHYPELAEGMLRALAANEAPLDLLVSTTSTAKAAALAQAFARYAKGSVTIDVVPNRGRDIGPMLSHFADKLQTYDVVGHMHGKRSLALTSVGLSTDVGVVWYEFLMQHLLGAKFPMADIILARFAAEPSLGLVYPEDPNLTGWSLDRDLAVALAARMDPAMVVPRFIDFPIGTMFWARPAALKPLFDLKLRWDDYPEEPVPIDGTMLHALERLLPVVCHHAGFVHETTHVPGVGR